MTPGIVKRMTLALALAYAAPASADEIALVIGNAAYKDVPETPSTERLFAAEDDFRRAGIEATFARDADMATIRRLLPQFLQMTNASDGQVIALAGQFATDGIETFFLPIGAPEPSLLNLYRQGLPLSLFLSILSHAPEGGILVLNHAGGSAATGPNWEWGLGPLDAPEGTAIVYGSSREATNFLRDTIADPRYAVDSKPRGMKVVGTLPSTPFLSGEDSDSETAREQLAWDLASGLDTVAAYRSYLAQHSDGFTPPMPGFALPRLPRRPRNRWKSG